MTGFDRVRPRRLGEDPATVAGKADREGRRALFSDAPAPPARGSVTVRCGRCGVTSVVSAAQAVRAGLPGVHLPIPRFGLLSWMRCPACRARGWVRATVQL